MWPFTAKIDWFVCTKIQVKAQHEQANNQAISSFYTWGLIKFRFIAMNGKQIWYSLPCVYFFFTKEDEKQSKRLLLFLWFCLYYSFPDLGLSHSIGNIVYFVFIKLGGIAWLNWFLAVSLSGNLFLLPHTWSDFDQTWSQWCLGDSYRS